MATAYNGDIFPGHPDGRKESVLGSLGWPVSGDLPPDEPGGIAAWVRGLSRILDWLVTLPEGDREKVIVVVSNESGCCGAALSRRNFGKTIDVSTKRFPHWFCPAFATIANREPAGLETARRIGRP